MVMAYLVVFLAAFTRMAAVLEGCLQQLLAVPLPWQEAASLQSAFCSVLAALLADFLALSCPKAVPATSREAIASVNNFFIALLEFCNDGLATSYNLFQLYGYLCT